MISELGRRLASSLEPSPRERLDPADPRTARPRADSRADAPAGGSPGRAAEDADPDADFALSLSSASLRLAEVRAESAADAPQPAPEAPRSPESGESDASPTQADGPLAPARPGPASRAIDAYREIARAPVGERVRIVV
ncbi:MAG: hypothetical protein IPK00_12375 [Deltaproteobacteria bacterium]|nr:hypothetical protein [Deltaproteobacteria bacterium]